VVRPENACLMCSYRLQRLSVSTLLLCVLTRSPIHKLKQDLTKKKKKKGARGEDELDEYIKGGGDYGAKDYKVI
jgi:hypothetical protein